MAGTPGSLRLTLAQNGSMIAALCRTRKANQRSEWLALISAAVGAAPSSPAKRRMSSRQSAQ